MLEATPNQWFRFEIPVFRRVPNQVLYQAEPLPDWCTGEGELSRARAEIAGLLADYNTLGWGSGADTAHTAQGAQGSRDQLHRWDRREIQRIGLESCCCLKSDIRLR